MQLAVTLTSLAIGALGEQALAHAFDDFMATVLAVVLAYLILTYLHVVLGELVPKGVALGHRERHGPCASRSRSACSSSSSAR